VSKSMPKTKLFSNGNCQIVLSGNTFSSKFF
jgi:hypothetical protein